MRIEPYPWGKPWSLFGAKIENSSVPDEVYFGGSVRRIQTRNFVSATGVLSPIDFASHGASTQFARSSWLHPQGRAAAGTVIAAAGRF
jgi:hypothetical protein